MSAPDEIRAIELEPAELAAARATVRRRRSIALGLVLAALVIIFYMLTLVKMGPAIFHRDL